jgi:hypothetical protein
MHFEYRACKRTQGCIRRFGAELRCRRPPPTVRGTSSGSLAAVRGESCPNRKARWGSRPGGRKAAKNLPGATDMLESVVKKAPQGLSAPIVEFNQYSRHALNSFVHTGIHPLRRARDGFPLEMATTIVRISNGLMHIAYRMLASLSGSQPRMNKVTHVFQEFTDCVPTAQSSQTSDVFRTNKVS